MFGANAFAWPYFGQGYAGGGGPTPPGPPIIGVHCTLVELRSRLANLSELRLRVANLSE